jgi:folate-binding Fe-S cluster repair protein YgfZ
MTEIALAANTPVTPLAALLESTVAPPELIAYRGALTPRELDAPATETAALAFGAAVHDLGWLKRVAVRGEDRFRWLSGMVTNTVNDLAPNAGAWNLVLNAQGRIQGDLTVWREAEELELEIAADQYDRLLGHLNHFIIMDDVELVPLSEEPAGETAMGLTGPLADDVLGRLSLPTLSEPLSSTRVEWNGFSHRELRNY